MHDTKGANLGCINFDNQVFTGDKQYERLYQIEYMFIILCHTC